MKSFLLLGIAGLLLGAGLGAQSPARQAAATNVSFPGPGGVTLRGYLALPPGNARGPAAVMVHEWWGLSQDIAVLADRLASEGFAVLAVDALRGQLAQTPQQASAQMAATPAAQIAGDLDAALAWLSAHPRVDATRLGALGFCFGGRQAMNLGVRNPSLKAVVTLYGSGLLQNAADLGSLGLNGPVLGIFGDTDASIPQAQRDGFRAALAQAGRRYAEMVYTGVGHAFVRDTNIDQPGAARQAWRQTVQFLQDELGR